MIYFTTNSDGKHTEGIGAMVQYQIICYVLSRLYNVGFYFTGFKNLTHYQYFNITQEKWCNDITNFFDFPISNKINYHIINFHNLSEGLEEFIKNNDNVIINFEIDHLMSFIDSFIDNENIQSILKELSSNILLKNNNLNYFEKEKLNISIHVRKYTQTDCDLNLRREYFDSNKQNFYINIIQNIESLLPNINKQYHIYSQGDIESFNFLHQLNVDIKLHIEEYPLISLYHMISSDIFITANSSFSYIAHLLGNYKMGLVRDTFFHKWNDNSILLDVNGNFNKNIFIESYDNQFRNRI
jgi:hypothetical protein